ERMAIGRLGLEERMTDELEALGIRTAGALAALRLPAVADRFGPEGIAGWRLARGEDEQYVAPRMPPEPLREWIDFGDPVGDEAGRQELLMRPAHEVRRERASEAARQLRAAMGDGHLLRVVEVAPWSRLPEGRELLVPYE